MKKLLQLMLGDAVDIHEMLKGEAKDGLDAIRRTGRYFLYWVVATVLLYLAGMLTIWSGGAETLAKNCFAAAALLSIAMLSIIWLNKTVIGYLIAIATTSMDELIGEPIPNVTPEKMTAILKKVGGIIIWVEFASLAALIMPIAAWKDPYLTIAAFVAAGIAAKMAIVGWTNGWIGKKLVMLTVFGLLAFFVGRNIPGVREYAASFSNEQVRTLALKAANRDLEEVPKDLLIAKLNELAELQKNAANSCGKLSCSIDDAVKISTLKAEIDNLNAITTAKRKGTTGPSRRSSTPASYATYGDHALPPPPAAD